MHIRFVIIEICRNPNEESDCGKIWYYKKTRTPKRTIVYLNENIYRESFFDKAGNIHRDNDLPAVIIWERLNYLQQQYYSHGQLHRGIYLPAVIHNDGRKEYWVYGEKRSETLSLKF